MIDNIDRLLTQLANHDNAIDTIDDNLANGTVRRTRISEWTLPNGETGRSIQKIIDHQPATNPYPYHERNIAIVGAGVLFGFWWLPFG